jgi:hypothetical protein
LLRCETQHSRAPLVDRLLHPVIRPREPPPTRSQGAASTRARWGKGKRSRAPERPSGDQRSRGGGVTPPPSCVVAIACAPSARAATEAIRNRQADLRVGARRGGTRACGRPFNTCCQYTGRPFTRMIRLLDGRAVSNRNLLRVRIAIPRSCGPQCTSAVWALQVDLAPTARVILDSGWKNRRPPRVRLGIRQVNRAWDEN